MLNLKDVRSTARGLPDYLNFAALIGDGLILCKDGMLLRGFYLSGLDTKDCSEYKRNAISHSLNRALRRLQGGWVLWVDEVKRLESGYPQPEFSFFPDPVSNQIDEERRSQFSGGRVKQFGYHHVFFLGYLPPLQTKKRAIDKLLFGEESNERQTSQDELVEKFLVESEELASHLGEHFEVAPMCEYEEDGSMLSPLLGYLQSCFSGEYYPLLVPPTPMYLDAIIGRFDAHVSTELAVGDLEVGVVALDGLPVSTYPQMMQALQQLTIEYRFSTRYISLDSHEALAHVKKYRRKWQQQVRGLAAQIFKTSKGIVNQNAIDRVAEADGAYAEIASSEVAYGYYSAVIIVNDASRAGVAAKEQEVARILKHYGFSPRIERLNAAEAWLGSIPGHAVYNVRRPLLSTRNLADLIPTNRPYQGEAVSPNPLFKQNAPPLFYAVAPGGVPLEFNLHVQDVGHSFIFGPTGAGKSVLLGFIAAQFLRYEQAQVFVFDKGRSMYPLTKAVGGKHIDLGDDSKLSLCPLADLESETSRIHAREWIETLVSLQGCSITPERTEHIIETLERFRDNQMCSLSSFRIALQDFELKAALSPYCSDGAVGALFDGDSDSVTFSNFVTFEMQEVMQLGSKYVLPFLLYLFRKIERNFKGHPSIIILDEAWLFLSHPVFAEQIRTWLKVLRKANCCLVMASQSLSDVEGSDIADVIAQECRTKILLANGSASTPLQRERYFRLGLSENDVALVSELTPKREYYLVSEKGRSVFDLQLGPYAHAFLARGDKFSLKRVAELSKSNGWQEQWLNECHSATSELEAV